MRLFAPGAQGGLAEAERALAAADPVMARLVAAVGPCRWVPSREPLFAALAQAIVYQQLAGKAAAAIWSRVEAVWDRSGGSAHGRASRLPTPAVVAATPVQKLRAAGLSRAKARALLDLAARAADGRLPLARLSRMSDEEVMQSVTQVRGIGPWTAHMFLIFRLGRPDVLPVGDHGVRKAAQRAYRMRALPSAERLVKVAEPWRPWRSVASWYLWRSLELD